ncbi:MAG: hypothetical protein BWY06_02800 [Candidatus Latescibacteria bacterium ADurb.Bin168]|nr:MAG: hypothetical protein BWY06_02800 [Candidatus Latescibacteria bacterium ADurb.Bin168]
MIWAVGLALRGGNWNNGTNNGVFASNLNNDRGNSNNNIGARPALLQHSLIRFGHWLDRLSGRKGALSLLAADPLARENIEPGPARQVSRGSGTTRRRPALNNTPNIEAKSVCPRRSTGCGAG